jgi:hypothetical protein
MKMKIYILFIALAFVGHSYAQNQEYPSLSKQAHLRLVSSNNLDVTVCQFVKAILVKSKKVASDSMTVSLLKTMIKDKKQLCGEPYADSTLIEQKGKVIPKAHVPVFSIMEKQSCFLFIILDGDNDRGVEYCIQKGGIELEPSGEVVVW